ncbi:LysR family transcriptional regulator [Bradyrhizobium iriomotense]|uniref:LysR family transcriptional regulator n=1 Tax=Bradyrhizobium iriomotense TaxID=441950 RepID=A0ABQ6ARY8_9BRAD|nr:LysR family transcriptional regulator [Bradyrhizobium iriomotense]GLR83689.1 LysR family transcriptional regulator [Bradyrhizobium iriomotense]
MSDPIDENRLRYLFESARYGSVRTAADALGVNPSVVSRQIAQLEQDLDATLLERHSRGVRPTEAGQLLVEHYRRHAADRDDTLTKLREIQGLQRGHIDLVLGEGFVADLMGGSLGEFWRRHPRLTISLELAGTSEVIRAIADDRCHIGLVYHPPQDPRIRSCAAIRQPICLIARPDHPLARLRRPVKLREVAEYALGIMHAGYGTRQLLAMAETSEKIGLLPKLTTTSISILRHFVRSDLGVTLLPAFSVAADLEDGSLVAIPVENALLASAEAHVITRLGRELPNAASQLLRFLIGRMKAFAAANLTP